MSVTARRAFRRSLQFTAYNYVATVLMTVFSKLFRLHKDDFNALGKALKSFIKKNGENKRGKTHQKLEILEKEGLWKRDGHLPVQIRDFKRKYLFNRRTHRILQCTVFGLRKFFVLCQKIICYCFLLLYKGLTDQHAAQCCLFLLFYSYQQ